MKPVSPVIPAADLDEVVVAEHQPEYQNLPVVRFADGIVLTRWKLTEEESAKVAESGDIFVYIWTGGGGIQPLLLMSEPPEVSGADVYEDKLLESEFIGADALKEIVENEQKRKKRYRIRCSFNAAPFEWGMEDGVINQNWIIPRNADKSAPELRSQMYPGYLKDDERHFGGGGIRHTDFDPYVETHKGKIIVTEDTWIVTNPNGEKEVYLSEDFHQIYSPEKV